MPHKPSRTIDTANTRNIIATRNTRNLTSWPALVKRCYLRLFNVRSTQKNESVYVFNGAALTTDKRDGRKKRPAPFLLFVCKTRKTPRGKAHAHSSEVRRITQSPRRLLLSFCRGVSILLSDLEISIALNPGDRCSSIIIMALVRDCDCDCGSSEPHLRQVAGFRFRL